MHTLAMHVSALLVTLKSPRHPGHNVLRTFDVSSNFPFTTSEAKCDF